MSAVSELRHLLRGSGFRRLTGTRLLSQLGDGMFQAGLATLLFFDPTQAATASDIALGFVVFFAPFTIVGPFVGPFIDRWQRQRIILVGNLARLVLAGLLGSLMVVDGPEPLIYLVAVLTLSLNRFLLAAMTAAIPRVVSDEDLLTANALLPTLGTLSALVGGGVGLVVTFVAPGLEGKENLQSLAALSLAGVTFGLSSWAATLIRKRELGPIHPLDSRQLREHVADLLRGLRSGAAYLARRVTPLHALLVMAAHRFLYGLLFVASILISRSILASPGDDGLGKFGIVVTFAGIGFGLAAILTPAFKPRVSRHSWVVACLLVGGAAQGLLAFSSAAWVLLTAAAILSFAVQGGKIAIDTIVQRDTKDSVRGRAFTLYDMAYNLALIASAGVCVLVLPDNGYSAIVMGATAAVYPVLALVYGLAPREPRPITKESASSTR